MVGAGPGNVELLTLKAYELITRADVILHDELISEQIRELFPANCRVINVGKRYSDGKDQEQRLQEIVQFAGEFLNPGKIFIRLKGGDPLIFSRSVEEIEAYVRAGIDVEIVPGITAGIAAGCSSLIPLTERLVSEGVMMVTGSTTDERGAHLKAIVGWLMLGNTVMLYMGFKRFREIRKQLMQFGIDSDIPAVAVSNVSMQDETTLWSDIVHLTQDADRMQLAMPVVILMGRRIRNLREK